MLIDDYDLPNLKCFGFIQAFARCCETFWPDWNSQWLFLGGNKIVPFIVFVNLVKQNNTSLLRRFALVLSVVFICSVKLRTLACKFLCFVKWWKNYQFELYKFISSWPIFFMTVDRATVTYVSRKFLLFWGCKLRLLDFKPAHIRSL